MRFIFEVVSDYNSWDGTSFSTPMVVGVCALVLSANPDLRTLYDVYEFDHLTDMIKHILYSTADPMEEWDPYIGNGVVDAKAAVVKAQTYNQILTFLLFNIVLFNFYRIHL